METAKKQENFKNSLESALVKAWQDDEFKKELIASPSKTIEKLTGNKLSLKEGVEMVVVDQSNPNKFYFNIPSKPDAQSFELAEEQLESVAGGGLIDLFKDAKKFVEDLISY